MGTFSRFRYGKFTTTVEHKVEYPAEPGDIIDVDVEIDIDEVVEEDPEIVAMCLEDFGYKVIKTNSLINSLKLDFIIENLDNLKLEDLENLI